MGFDGSTSSDSLDLLRRSLWERHVFGVATDFEYERRRERYPDEEWDELREALGMVFKWLPGVVVELLAFPEVLPVVSEEWLFNWLWRRGYVRSAGEVSSGEALLVVKVVTRLQYEGASYPRIELA